MRTNRLFTVGYAGRTLDEFVDILTEVNVSRVVDVRELPLSRRRGFSKTKLRQTLQDAGIEYVHLRAAGNPYRDFRKDIERCLRMYRGYINDRPEVVEELTMLAGSKPTALLCVEADHTCCHRSVLAEHMTDREHELTVQHL